MTLRISVITVTLNSERFLNECLLSVAAQGKSLYEHIIVDGGSDDNTLDIIKNYARCDARVRWISEPDKGISDAMNKGVMMATGDVITHLNSDDYYPTTDTLSAVLDCFTRNPSEMWVTGGVTFVSEKGKFIRDIKVRRYSFNRLLRGNILLHPSTFIKLDLFNAVGGFDDSLSYCMDYDLYLRLGSIAAPLALDKQLSCFRVHQSSRSVSHSELAYAEEFKVRMDYLRSNGLPTFFYRLDNQLKRIFNGSYYRKLLSHNRG